MTIDEARSIRPGMLLQVTKYTPMWGFDLHKDDVVLVVAIDCEDTNPQHHCDGKSMQINADLVVGEQLFEDCILYEDEVEFI